MAAKLLTGAGALVRFRELSLVRGCLAMRGLSGWLRFKDTTVDKPSTRLERRRGRRWSSREGGRGRSAGRLRKFIADEIDCFVKKLLIISNNFASDKFSSEKNCSKCLSDRKSHLQYKMVKLKQICVRKYVRHIEHSATRIYVIFDVRCPRELYIWAKLIVMLIRIITRKQNSLL